MPSSSSSLWLPTASAIAAWVIAMALHFKWHPQRRHFSAAWDVLARMPWLVMLMAALILLSPTDSLLARSQGWPGSLLFDWRAVAAPLALLALETYAFSLHSLLPHWPLAIASPAVATLLAWRLHRRPYRYQSRRQSLAEAAVLLAAVLLGWGWLALEITHLARSMAEWLETARLLLRSVYSALGMALSQVLLIRLALHWEAPPQVDQQQDLRHSLEATFSRWHSVFALAALDLLWLLWVDAASPRAARWIGIEAMLLFAPLPVAVALGAGSPLDSGAAALLSLRRLLLPWLGVAVTAGVVLMFVHYACAVFEELAGTGSLAARLLLPLRALALATAHSWLFLATVFTFLRHGFKAHSSSAGAA